MNLKKLFNLSENKETETFSEEHETLRITEEIEIEITLETRSITETLLLNNLQNLI